MELDKRILGNRKPFTVFDIGEAQNFVQKICYFSNTSTDFEDLPRFCVKGVMYLVPGESPYCFDDKNGKRHSYRYCIPVSFVNTFENIFEEAFSDLFNTKYPVEFKKLRMFTMREFLTLCRLNNDWLTLREKANPDRVSVLKYSGHEQFRDIAEEKQHIFLSGHSFNLAELFKYYEYFNPKFECWVPMGIKE